MRRSVLQSLLLASPACSFCSGPNSSGSSLYSSIWAGIVLAVGVLLGLVFSIFKTQSFAVTMPQTPALTVKQIGEALMANYVWPLQCVGLVLTAALIGALVLVMEDKR